MNIYILTNIYILILMFYTTLCSGFKMLPINKIPIIIAYKNIDKHIEVGLNHPKTRSKIALITSHGITDLISFKPIHILPRYFNAACLCFYTNTEIKAILVFLFSIYHFSRDMIGTGQQKLVQSILLHTVFIYKPEQVVNYLFFIHSPLHLYRFFKQVDYRWFPVILIVTNLIYYFPTKNIDIHFIKVFTTFAVLGHIMCYAKIL